MRLPVVALPLLAAVFAVLLPSHAADAALLVTIDKGAQRMSVKVDGVEKHSWTVSTGRVGHATPVGSFTPFRLEEDHYSKEWDDAPMPHSVFFTKQGHAIHGSLQTKQLGSPASAGCVRLAPANAQVLFGMVKEAGLNNTKVVIAGTEPAPLVASRRSRGDEATVIPPDASGARVRGGDAGVDAYTTRMRQRYYEERAAAESYRGAPGYYQNDVYYADSYGSRRYAPRVYAQPDYAPQPYYGDRGFPYVRRYGY